jgi:GNAT superfamily N-acetyltransferase
MDRPEVRTLSVDDVGLIAEIDRSEQIDVEYTVVHGRLAERPVSFAEVPEWDPIGTGSFSVAARIAFCEPLVRAGGTLLGAYQSGEFMGLALVDGDFEPARAWLAFLHVSRPYRRRGAASRLWSASVDIALDAGARSMYVSATPTGSAVGFYLSRGCHLADPVNPELYAMEPDDIHLVCDLG